MRTSILSTSILLTAILSVGCPDNSGQTTTEGTQTAGPTTSGTTAQPTGSEATTQPTTGGDSTGESSESTGVVTTQADTTEGESDDSSETTTEAETDSETTGDPIEPGPGQCRDDADCTNTSEICWEATPDCQACNQAKVLCTNDEQCDAMNPGWKCQPTETSCVCGHYQIGRECGPPCATSDDCAGSIECLDGTCTILCGCIDDASCSPGEVCIDSDFDCGQCTPGFCMVDGDCPEDEVCVNHFCRSEFGSCIVPNE